VHNAQVRVQVNLIEGDSMRSAIVLLERSSLIPKDMWRDPSCHRTLMPIEVSHLITNAWKSNQPAVAEKGSIVMSLQPDGSAKEPPSVHPIQGEQKDFIGVFDVSFISLDRVKVTLREEECARRVGSPRRNTRQIALLQPWKPLRVLVNGRSSGFGYSSQLYILREYHLALCADPAPDRLAAPRFVDLQADLF
jgi:hypothetical protein